MIGRVFAVLLVLVSICGVAFSATPWDFLRPSIDAANTMAPLITAIVLLISAAIFFVALLAYTKKKSSRLLLVAVAFGLFGLKRILYLVDLFASPGIFMNIAIEGIFDLLILACLFVAIFRK